MSKKIISIDDVNQQLAEQLMRMNTELSEEDLKAEISKSKAMKELAQTIFNGKKLVLEAMKLVSDGNVYKEDMPDFLPQKQLSN